jgi:hypothetical protein
MLLLYMNKYTTRNITLIADTFPPLESIAARA